MSQPNRPATAWRIDAAHAQAAAAVLKHLETSADGLSAA